MVIMALGDETAKWISERDMLYFVHLAARNRCSDDDTSMLFGSIEMQTTGKLDLYIDRFIDPSNIFHRAHRLSVPR